MNLYIATGHKIKPDSIRIAPCIQRLKTTDICLYVKPHSLPKANKNRTHNPNGNNAKSVHLNFLISNTLFILLFKFDNRINIEYNLLRLPPPITLWNDATYTIMQMSRFSLSIASVSNPTNH